MKQCFVTVGSTRFDSLIEAFLQNEVVNALTQIGIEHVTIQNGNGNIPTPFKMSEEDKSTINHWQTTINKIKFQLYRFKPNINDDFLNADLVIGHAGAGTCLEVLEMGKPFVAVVNDSLMDNHQSELAEKLAEDEHLLFTTPGGLAQTLLDPNLSKLKPFEKTDPLIFRRFVEQYILCD